MVEIAWKKNCSSDEGDENYREEVQYKIDEAITAVGSGKLQTATDVLRQLLRRLLTNFAN